MSATVVECPVCRSRTRSFRDKLWNDDRAAWIDCESAWHHGEVLDELDALESQNQALQEALREIEAGPYNGFEQCRAIARSALSPTQETDPE